MRGVRPRGKDVTMIWLGGSGSWGHKDEISQSLHFHYALKGRVRLQVFYEQVVVRIGRQTSSS